MTRWTRIALVAAAVGLGGCTQWHYDQPSAAGITAHQHRRVVLKLRNGNAVALSEPEMAGDSVVGVIERSEQPGHPLKRYAVPLDSVRGIAYAMPSFTRSSGLVILPAAGLVVGGVLLGY